MHSVFFPFNFTSFLTFKIFLLQTEYNLILLLLSSLTTWFLFKELFIWKTQSYKGRMRNLVYAVSLSKWPQGHLLLGKAEDRSQEHLLGLSQACRVLGMAVLSFFPGHIIRELDCNEATRNQTGFYMGCWHYRHWNKCCATMLAHTSFIYIFTPIMINVVIKIINILLHIVISNARFIFTILCLFSVHLYFVLW